MKRVLVIGGSGYLGRAIVESLIGENTEILATYYLNAAPLEEIKQKHKGKLWVEPCNILEVGQLCALREKILNNWGCLDAIIGCYALNPQLYFKRNQKEFQNRNIDEIEKHDFENSLLSEGLAGFNIVQNFASLFQSQKKGQFLFLNSLDAAKMMPSPISLAMSKQMIRGLVQSAAKEFGPSNVLINEICLGICEGGVAQFVPETLKKDYLRHCALGRFANNLEVARFVRWMALNNSYLTGQSLTLDGGV